MWGSIIVGLLVNSLCKITHCDEELLLVSEGDPGPGPNYCDYPRLYSHTSQPRPGYKEAAALTRVTVLIGRHITMYRVKNNNDCEQKIKHLLLSECEWADSPAPSPGGLLCRIQNQSARLKTQTEDPRASELCPDQWRSAGQATQ